MSIDLQTYEPVGDKKNSDFFNEYRLKIYERRTSAGLDELFGDLRGLVVQVDHGDGVSYLEELYLMTPYRLTASYISETHRVYVLQSQPQFPRFFLLEPLSPSYVDDLRRFNMMYPLARPKT